MTADEFRRLTHNGHGRAIVYAAEHDVECFRESIVDLCLHCRAYDPQIDGTHAVYALSLLDQMPAREDYYKMVLEALPDAGDDYDAVHRFHIAVCLAMNGDKHARRALYTHYNPGPKHGVHIALDFVDMDGLDGLRFVAAKLGGMMLAGIPALDVGWLVSHSRERLGETSIQTALSGQATTDPRIAVFRGAVERSLQELGQPCAQYICSGSANYAELKPRLMEFKPGQLQRWGKFASAAELESAAHGLDESGDLDDTLHHLWIFGDRSFPIEPAKLIELVDSRDLKLARGAAAALVNVNHPGVRDLAKNLIREQRPIRDFAVGMLASNYDAGDHETVLEWFEEEEDIEVQHGMDVLMFWKQHPDPISEIRMLNLLYDRTPCTQCREDAVERLIELGALTEQMRVECSFDSSDEIRGLVSAE